MAQDAVLDQVFWALSDATRRSVIERLTRFHTPDGEQHVKLEDWLNQSSGRPSA